MPNSGLFKGSDTYTLPDDETPYGGDVLSSNENNKSLYGSDEIVAKTIDEDVVRAETAATEAEASATAAAASAVDAQSSEDDAEASQIAAAASAAAASTSATNAATSETLAAASAAAAQSSEDDAEVSQIAAAASALAASTSETNAAASASAASTSASNAATSETNAAGSASAAAASALDAQSSEDDAEVSQIAAAASASAAATSASNAATSESNAATSASNAATSEANADDAALEAQHWANYPEDAVVPEGVGEFSSKHYAAKAEQAAIEADVTFESLNSKGDVGTGADQLAQGNHLHTGVYEPVDSTILREGDYALGVPTATVQNVDYDTLYTTYQYTGMVPHLLSNIAANRPDDHFFYVHQYWYTATTGAQVAIPYVTGRDTYIRHLAGGVWTAWKQYAYIEDIDAHSADTTSVHGIADTSLLLDTGDIGVTVEPAGTVASHEADTTSVHGIANTALLEIKSVTQGSTLYDFDTLPDVNPYTGMVPNLTAGDSTNGPVAPPNCYFYVWQSIYTGGAKNCVQVAYPYLNGQFIYYRHRYNSVWTDWKRIASTDDINTHNADTTSVHGIADTSLLLDTGDIGVTVQGYDATILKDANLEGFDDTGRHKQFTGDLDTILHNSIYNFLASSVTNEPAGITSWGFIHTMMYTTNTAFATQICYSMNSGDGEVYIRHRASAVWGPWIDIGATHVHNYFPVGSTLFSSGDLDTLNSAGFYYLSNVGACTNTPAIVGAFGIMQVVSSSSVGAESGRVIQHLTQWVSGQVMHFTRIRNASIWGAWRTFSFDDHIHDDRYYTEAEVDALLAGVAGSEIVTYENLDANGDVGTAAGQVATGNHLHTGVYAPVDHATNASTYGYGTTLNAGHLRVGTNLSVSNGTVSAPNASETTKGVVELANLAETVFGTDTTRAVTPANLAVVNWTKVFVVIDGTGTVGTIRAQGVSSVTDLGIGDYRANFSTAMPDTNYGVLCSSSGNTPSGTTASSVGAYNRLTTSISVKVWDTAGNAFRDGDAITISILD